MPFRCLMAAMLCCHLVIIIIKKTLLSFNPSLIIDIIPNTNTGIRIDISIKVIYCLFSDLKYMFSTQTIFSVLISDSKHVTFCGPYCFHRQNKRQLYVIPNN